VDAEKWGETIRAIQVGGPNALAAKWSACFEAVKHADQLKPWPMTNPDGWSQEKDIAIDRLRPYSDIDKVRAAAQTTCPRDFGLWRVHAQDIEAKNAARLQVLCGVLQTLYSMQHDPDLADTAGELMDKIANALESHWKILAKDIPINSSYRDWCVSKTRDYRSLPKFWRYV